MVKSPRARFSVGYVRVSTSKQDQSGISLEEQRRRIEAWAVGNKVALEQVYEDSAESGADLDRPWIQAILSRVKVGEIGRIAVYKLDRLTRSVKDLYDLISLFEKHDVALCSVMESLDTSSAMGRMMVGMIGIFAQWEREAISERTIMAMDAKRRKGERLGGHRPYGWKFSGRMLVPDLVEHEILRSIIGQRNGGFGYSEISEWLNRQGIKPARGKRWYTSSVRAVILRAQKATL